MKKDIDFIRQLEKETDIALKQDRFDELLESKQNGYTITEQGAVTGLCLFKISLASLAGTIVQFQHLERLVLSEVDVKARDFSSLSQIASLTLLDLSGNNIDDISCIAGVKSLTQLYLGNNDIKDLSPLEDLVHLSALDLRNNRFTKIRHLEKLHSLKIINLQDNRISDISPLQELSSIVYLNVSVNTISDLSPIGGLGKLAYLDAAHNQIDDISTLSGLPALTYLNLAGNKITDISPIRELTGLTILKLSNNRINSIFSLIGLLNLTDLDLGGNEISDISSLVDLHKLAKLVLNKNRISDLLPLSHMRALAELYLGSNQISDLSPLQELKSLTGLYLDSNRINDLSPLQGLNALNVLILRFNQITDIMPLQGLKALTKLYLDSNQISDLLPLQGLETLISLSLGSNQISELSALQGLNALNVLYLSTNQITDLSPLKALKALSVLHLDFNKITDLSPLQELKSLKELNLSSNQISDLSPLKALTALSYLFVNSNRINDLSPLHELKALIYLWLDSNLITELSPLQALDALTELRLKNNQISELSHLLVLKNLQLLDLSKNKISQLPQSILDLNLDIKWENDLHNGIFLEGNPLESPPVEIVKQGNAAVRNYFKEIERQKTVLLLQCKLLLVGPGEVGKTTLMKKLKDPSFKVQPGLEAATHGINIIPWELPCTFANGDTLPVKIHFWDFGGQDIYHATHQFFLTKRSLYILVWEARKEEETRTFAYWLNVISLLGGDSPVLVVMNKADIRSISIDEASLLKKFPAIKGFLRVSCLEDTGLPQLTEQVRETLGKMPHLRDPLPASWLHVRDDLKALDKNYIDAESYYDLCAKHDIPKDTASTLGGYLHDLGIILYFRDDPLLADTVILNPEWATKALYALLDSKEIIDANGSFLFRELKRYWDPTLYPEAKHRQVVRLMEKFELCFNFLHTGKYFIPELLPGTPVTAETSAYEAPGTLHFQYRYRFMPEGILSRFIARLYYLIRGGRFRKYGVELQFEKATALVQGQPLENRINIAAAGPGKSQLLAIIRSHFTHIHQTLDMRPGTHYDEMLPCICPVCSQKSEPEEPEYYAYETLKKARAAHARTIQCHSSFEAVSVASLLEGFEPPEPGLDILTALLQSAKQVMGLSKSMKPDEDSRTGFLCVLMAEKGYQVKDQTRWGLSGTGLSMGRLDAVIKTPDGREVILEAFKLTTFEAGKIESHCRKIFQYDPLGLENNFMVVYCDCPGKDFVGLWEKYRDKVREIDYPYTLHTLEERTSPYPAMRVARAIHLRHQKEVGIYHLFLHMQ